MRQIKVFFNLSLYIERTCIFLTFFYLLHNTSYIQTGTARWFKFKLIIQTANWLDGRSHFFNQMTFSCSRQESVKLIHWLMFQKSARQYKVELVLLCPVFAFICTETVLCRPLRMRHRQCYFDRQNVIFVAGSGLEHHVAASPQLDGSFRRLTSSASHLHG